MRSIRQDLYTLVQRCVLKIAVCMLYIQEKEFKGCLREVNCMENLKFTFATLYTPVNSCSLSDISLLYKIHEVWDCAVLFTSKCPVSDA